MAKTSHKKAPSKETIKKIKETVNDIVEECTEIAAEETGIGIDSDEVFKLLMASATNFCTVLLAEQVDDDEAAIRSAEIAASLFDEVSYQLYRMMHPVGGDNG